MAYTEQQKTNCVKIYTESESAESALIEIRQMLSITPSRRSLENWAKDPKYKPQVGKGELALFNHEADIPTQTQKKIAVIKKITPAFTEGLTKVSKRVLDNLTDAKLRAMEGKDLIYAYVRLQNLKLKNGLFVASLLENENDDSPDKVIEMLGEAMKKARGNSEDSIIDTEVINEGEMNERKDSLSG
jgi:hypothetical protein